MSASDYIAANSVFTTEDIQAISPSRETAETTLRRAVAAGKIERIRRGLYASRVGVFATVTPDPLDVVTVVDPDAVLSYGSALAVHGLSHNISFDCTFRTDRVRSGFTFDGVRYKPYRANPNIAIQRKRLNGGSYVAVTTREQTFVDCLTHSSRAGGVEEVIRALSGIAYLDLQVLAKMLEGASGAVRARAGWLLEANKGKWSVPDMYLFDLASKLDGGAVRFGSKNDPTLTWSKRWKLSLPYDEEELSAWVG